MQSSSSGGSQLSASPSRDGEEDEEEQSGTVTARSAIADSEHQEELDDLVRELMEEQPHLTREECEDGKYTGDLYHNLI